MPGMTAAEAVDMSFKLKKIDALDNTDPRDIRLSRDGKKIIYSDSRKVYKMNSDGSRPPEVVLDLDAISSSEGVSFSNGFITSVSHDGSKATIGASSGYGGVGYILDTVTGKLSKTRACVVSDHPDPPCLNTGGGILSGDGKYLFFASNSAWDCTWVVDEARGWSGWECALPYGTTRLWRVPADALSSPLSPMYWGEHNDFLDVQANYHGNTVLLNKSYIIESANPVTREKIIGHGVSDAFLSDDGDWVAVKEFNVEIINTVFRKITGVKLSIHGLYGITSDGAWILVRTPEEGPGYYLFLKRDGTKKVYITPTQLDGPMRFFEPMSLSSDGDAVLLRQTTTGDSNFYWMAFKGHIAVNATDDKSDAAPGDGVCDVDLKKSGEQCSLRAAIEEANKSKDAGSATIAFDIPITDPGYSAVKDTFTIRPKKPLPGIRKSLIIEPTHKLKNNKSILKNPTKSMS
ncbi:MAG: CSLREA domain-containing protein [Nitrospinae bacterium]|nr:CSLREA domain-containing protein [Nitrospinota bacterium]